MMASLDLKFVESWTDRTGRRRHYFRRGHGPRIALPGEPGTAEFMAAYQAAMEIKPRAVGKDAHAPGTFAWLASAYFTSPNFRALKASTQEVSRRIIERFVAKHGHRLVRQFQREHLLKILGEMAATPAAANNLRKKIKVLVGFAIDDLKIRMEDPTVRIKRYKEGEHHTWNDQEIETFEKAFPLGTFQRTAFALHLYTGQRRDDVRRMAWTDIDGETISVVQEKGGEKLEIPLHPELRKALAKWSRRHVAILVGPRGKPYTVESYGNMMADAIDDAGLPERCVLHGVRKAAARRLAEAGCSAKEIAAITGHKSLKEVERYTRAADQKRLARAAIHRLPSVRTPAEQGANAKNRHPKSD